MTSNSTVVPLCQSDAIDDPLTAILRSGARRLLAQAIEAEAETFLATMKGVQLPDGRERLVRHGLGPERVIQTGIGPVEVRRVKLRDRGASEGAERIRFTSSILPRWARRTPSLDALLPILYLRGVSMGDFQEALGALELELGESDLEQVEQLIGVRTGSVVEGEGHFAGTPRSDERAAEELRAGPAGGVDESASRKGRGGASAISATPTTIKAGTSPSRCPCSAVFCNACTVMMPA